MTARRAMGSHQSAASGTDTWLTPPAIHAALGGWESFDLDPASAMDQPWPTARAHYTERDNGLIKPWFGRVFLNPPYSNPLVRRFMGRMADHGQGVALIFARTETETFERHVWGAASAVLFLFGRLNFHRIDGVRAAANAGAPSVLCAYGRADAEVLAACDVAGQFVPLDLPRIFAVMAIAVTWGEVVAAEVAARPGPVRLDELYRAVARHPKARRNRHVAAKVRQVLQRGGFERVGRGLWRMAA